MDLIIKALWLKQLPPTALSVIFIRLKSMVKSSVQLNSVVWEFFWDLSISGLRKLVILTFLFSF